MNKLMKRILVFSILFLSVFVNSVFAAAGPKQFYLQVDGEKYSDIDDIKYVSEKGLIERVNTISDQKSLSDINKDLKRVGDTDVLNLMVDFKPNVVINGVVYRQGTNMENSFNVIRVPKYTFKPIFLDSSDQPEDIKNKLNESATPVNESEVSGEPRFYFGDISKIYDTFYSSERADVYYQYRKGYLPIRKSVEVYRINTIPAVVSKDMKNIEIENKIKESINYDKKENIKISKEDIKLLDSSANKKFVSFSIVDDEGSNLYNGNIEVRLLDKAEPKENLVEFKVSTQSGIQSVLPKESTKLYGSKFDRSDIIYSFKKGDDVQLEVKSDNRYKLSSVRASEVRDGVSDTKDYEFKVDKDSHAISCTINGVTRNVDVRISRSTGYLNVYFYPDSSYEGLKSKYEREYAKLETIDRLPNDYQRDIDNIRNIYDITEYTNQYKNIMEWVDLPIAEGDKSQKLYFAEYGTGVVNIQTEVKDRDYIYVNDDLEYIIKGNRELITANNADLSKTQIVPLLDTSRPSELLDANNLKGKVKPSTVNVTYFADVGNDKDTESSKTVPLKIKVLNEGNSLTSTTINRDFSDNIAQKTDKGFVYNKSIQEEIEEKVYGRINRDKVKVYLTELTAKEKSKVDGKAYYIDLGDPSKEHQELDGFVDSNKNNMPRDSKDIKKLSGEISIKEVVLYENGKEVIRVTGKDSLDQYKLSEDKNLYRFGQYQYTTNDIFPTIRYSIGDDDRGVSNRSSIKIYTTNVTSNPEDVKKYRDLGNNEKEIRSYDTNKLLVQDGKIGNSPNTKDKGREIPNTTYLEELLFNRLPEVGKNYVTEVTVEDITDYNNSCDDKGENCQKVDFSVPTYDENKESYSERQIKPPYNIKTKVTVYYDPDIINNRNVVEYTFDTKLDIVIKEKDKDRPNVTNIKYVSDAPRVYKDEEPNPNIIKDGIVITIDNKKVDAELEVVDWDSSKVGYSTANIKIKYDNKEYIQPIDILVVNKMGINYQPKTISVNKEKVDNGVKIYDSNGDHIITSTKDLSRLDNKFADNFKQIGKFANDKDFNIIYDATKNIRPDSKNRIVVNNIEFSSNLANKVFSNDDIIYPSFIEMSIYTDYLNNNESKTVSTGEIKLRLMLSDSRPRGDKVLKEIKLNNRTYYLHYDVFNKYGSTGPVMLLNPSDFKDLYTPLTVISNYKELYTINFKYNGKNITNYSTSAFSNSILYENDIPEEIMEKISKYSINWDVNEKDKVGVVRNGIVLNSNPKIVNLMEVPVDYKINLVDERNNPIELENVELSGKTPSGSTIQDIVGKIDGYIPLNAEELNTFTNFKFDKDNSEASVVFTKMPTLRVQNFTTNDKVYQGNFDVDKYLMDNKYFVAPELGSTRIEELVNDGIIKNINIKNTDPDPFKLEDKTGKLEIVYFDGQTQEYSFEYNYKIGYKISSDQFTNKTIKVGDKLPSNLSWASNLTGIKSFTVTIEDFVENTPGKYSVVIEPTDLSGEKHEVIHKTLTVIESEKEITPDNPTTPGEGEGGSIKPIQPGEELTPNDNEDSRISELNPGKEITPKDPKDITSEVVVPGEIDNSSSGNIEPDNSENNGGVVNNNSESNSGVVNNNSGIVGNEIGDNSIVPDNNDGIVSGGVVSDTSDWNIGGSYTGSSKYDQDTPTYNTTTSDNKRPSKTDSSTPVIDDYRSVLEESIRYADNIILNSKKYNKSSYTEFLNKYEEIKNILNSNEDITKDKANALSEELSESIKGLKSKGFFSKKPAVFVEIDLRNPKISAPIKDIEENIVGTYDLTGLPELINDRTYLSVRDVANILGMNVNWNNSNRTATFTKDGKVVSINIDTKDVFVDGNKQSKLENDIKIINDRIYCPLTNISKYFGITNGNIDDNINQDIEYYNNGTVRIYIK